jgi:hypothetical protein
MSASHQAYRHARLKGLLDDPNLLRRCPAPTALNRWYQKATTVHVPPRQQASLGLLAGVVTSFPFPRGCYGYAAWHF